MTDATNTAPASDAHARAVALALLLFRLTPDPVRARLQLATWSARRALDIIAAAHCGGADAHAINAAGRSIIVAVKHIFGGEPFRQVAHALETLRGAMHVGTTAAGVPALIVAWDALAAAGNARDDGVTDEHVARALVAGNTCVVVTRSKRRSGCCQAPVYARHLDALDALVAEAWRAWDPWEGFVIDLVAELRAAGLAIESIEAVVERAVERVVRRLLDEREHDGLVDLAGLAALLGCSVAAAKQRTYRDPELAALAVRVGTRRRWRRMQVLALLESRR